MKYTFFFATNNLIKIVVLLSLFLLTTYDDIHAQSMQWVNTFIGNTTITSVALTSDNSGNNYQAGRFTSLVDFDPGPGIYNMNASAFNGNLTARAAYISKTDASGNHLWAKSFIPYSNSAESFTVAMDVDNNNNVISLGNFHGTVDFDPGPAIDTLSMYPNVDVAYIAKLDVNGNYLWSKKIAALNPQAGGPTVYGVKAGPSNCIYIYGIFGGTFDFDLGPGVFNVTATDAASFILKLDSNGNFIWVKTWDYSGNSPNGIGNGAMDIDANENVYFMMTAYEVVPADLDPGPGVYSTSGSNFLVKINSAGNFLWGGASTTVNSQVHIDRYGAVYTSGEFDIQDDVDPGPGTYILNNPGKVYITKSDANGNLIWVKEFKKGVLQHISTDTLGNVYNAWLFNALAAGSIDCDPDTGTYVIHTSNYNYIFCSLDSSGSFRWAKKARWPAACSNTGIRMHVNTANELMISGRYCNVLDIDFSPAVYNIGQSGKSSTFLMKYNYCGNTDQTFYVGCDSVVLVDTTYLAAVDYVKEYLDMNNCDSNVNIHVKFLTPAPLLLNTCDTAFSYFGQIYTQSGVYTQIVPNGIGCDSVHHLTLNFNTPANQPPILNLIQTFQPYYPTHPSATYAQSLNVEIDSLYNMYISGSFSQEIDFNPLGVPYMDTSYYTLYGTTDGFVTRYDSSGILAWMHKIQTLGVDVFSGNEYTPVLCLNDGLELYSATYGTEGTNVGMNAENQFAYANTWFGTTQVVSYPVWNVNQILNDPTSSLPVKIGFHDSVDIPGYAYKDLVVWKGNNSATFSTGGQYVGYQGAVDLQGNIYVVSDMQPIDPGPSYCMIAKLDANLNMLWNKQIAGGMVIKQLKIDTGGSLLLCGYFVGTLDIDISPNTYNLVSHGGFDAFIARFDTAANFLWAHSWGGADDDYANSIITDMNGGIYVGGTFASTSIDLDPTAGISFLMKGCAYANWGGGYISKFEPDGTFIKAMGSGSSITELEFKAPKRIYATGVPFVQVFEVDYVVTINNIVNICIGDSIMVGNNIYNQSGVYIDSFITALGDSIVITTLTVNPNSSSSTNISICANQTPYLWNGQNFDSSGIYTVNLTNIYGCDSAATLNLNVSPCIVCVPDFTINYSPFYNSLTESQSWIITSGTVVVLAGTHVKLDAHASSYVQLNPGFKVEHGAIFVAQAYNGCTAGAPQLPQSGRVFNSESVAPNEIILYPNPTTGMIHIKHDEKLIGIQIFDMVGKLIINRKCDGETETNIDLSNLPNGIYHVKASGYNSIKVVKND